MKAEFTIEDILKMNPCEEYTRERITELFAGRKTVTGLDISKMDIPGADFRWVVLRPDFITENNLHKIAIYCAEKIALPIWLKYYPDDNRPAEAIRIKKLWLKGEATDAELNAADAAAYATIKKYIIKILKEQNKIKGDIK
jgi:hypothetical protein